MEKCYIIMMNKINIHYLINTQKYFIFKYNKKIYIVYLYFIILYFYKL